MNPENSADPFGTDPFGADPFGADPFGTDPFGAPGGGWVRRGPAIGSDGAAAPAATPLGDGLSPPRGAGGPPGAGASRAWDGGAAGGADGGVIGGVIGSVIGSVIGGALPGRVPGLPEQRGGPGVPPVPDPAAAPRSLPVTGPSSVVRPYVRTGGRTRARLDLSLETLVSLLPRDIPYRLPHDEAAVLDLCRAQSRSVAEVAALHQVPIGVAKVIIGDLAAAGLLAVHRSFAASGPDLALMERVLGGLRRI